MIEHQALLYGTSEEFVDVAVPFLEQALVRGGMVLAVIAEANIQPVRWELGSFAQSVTFIPATAFYRHPVRTVAHYARILTETGPGNRLWALAEPVWDGLTQVQTAEWKRYESVVNGVFAESAVSVICAYDTRTAAPDVLASARRTHQALVVPHQTYPNPDYLPPDRFDLAEDHLPLPEPRTNVHSLALCHGLGELRRWLAGWARYFDLDEERTQRLLGAGETIADNALRHGAPPVTARAWAEDGWMTCEIADGGYWTPDPLEGHAPRESNDRFGLWGARLLADTLTLRTGHGGTVVRMEFDLS